MRHPELGRLRDANARGSETSGIPEQSHIAARDRLGAAFRDSGRLVVSNDPDGTLTAAWRTRRARPPARGLQAYAPDASHPPPRSLPNILGIDAGSIVSMSTSLSALTIGSVVVLYRAKCGVLRWAS